MFAAVVDRQQKPFFPKASLFFQFLSMGMLRFLESQQHDDVLNVGFIWSAVRSVFLKYSTVSKTQCCKCSQSRVFLEERFQLAKNASGETYGKLYYY